MSVRDTPSHSTVTVLPGMILCGSRRLRDVHLPGKGAGADEHKDGEEDGPAVASWTQSTATYGITISRFISAEAYMASTTFMRSTASSMVEIMGTMPRTALTKCLSSCS